MPELDISELLTDPDLCDNFTLLRRNQSVNQYGEVNVTVQTFDYVIGAVFPSGSQSLRIDESFQTQSKSITVVTRFRLRGATQKNSSTQFQPDIIVWNGDNFQVESVNDFSRYGGGFVQAECTSVDLVDLPPPYNQYNPNWSPGQPL